VVAHRGAPWGEIYYVFGYFFEYSQPVCVHNLRSPRRELSENLRAGVVANRGTPEAKYVAFLAIFQVLSTGVFSRSGQRQTDDVLADGSQGNVMVQRLRSMNGRHQHQRPLRHDSRR